MVLAAAHDTHSAHASCEIPLGLNSFGVFEFVSFENDCGLEDIIYYYDKYPLANDWKPPPLPEQPLEDRISKWLNELPFLSSLDCNQLKTFFNKGVDLGCEALDQGDVVAAKKVVNGLKQVSTHMKDVNCQ